MDSVLRGWVIDRPRQARAHWGAVAYSEITGMAWAYHHRSARQAEKAALAHCPGPPARLWARGTNITIAVARGPRGAVACHWADSRLPTQAAIGAPARCQATYPTRGPDRHHVWLALVLDTRHGVLYPHEPAPTDHPRISPPSGGVTSTPQASGGRGATPNLGAGHHKFFLPVRISLV